MNKPFKIATPDNISTSNYNSHGWVVNFCVLSSIALSFGNTANSESYPILNTNQCATIIEGRIFSSQLITELNTNAEIKDNLISRLLQFKNELKLGWNGNAELPMEERAVSNAIKAIEATSSGEFTKWTVFPSPNGTILFSPIDDFIAGISIGNDEFSYAAIGNHGQEIKGKEAFSVKSFKLVISLINSMNEA